MIKLTNSSFKSTLRAWLRFVFGGTLDRRHYLLGLLGFAGLVVILFFLTAFIAGGGRADDDGSLDAILLIALIGYFFYLAGFVVYTVSIVVKRLRSIGLPPVLVLILFVPQATIIYLLVLALPPPGLIKKRPDA